MEDLKVAGLQMDLKWQDPSSNRARAEDMMSDLNVDLIVLPEMFTTGFTMEVENNFELPEGASEKWLMQLSSKKNAVITGSWIVKEEGRFFNRLHWADPRGELFTYDKRHLFRMAEEHKSFTAGGQKIFPEVKGWRVCPLICYDLRFPVWSRNNGDYDLLLFVANWPEARRSAWKTLSRARAMENLSPVIAINRIGQDGKGISYSGDSTIFDAKGEILDLKGVEEGVIKAELKVADLKQYRERFPAHLDADQFRVL